MLNDLFIIFICSFFMYKFTAELYDFFMNCRDTKLLWFIFSLISMMTYILCGCMAYRISSNAVVNFLVNYDEWRFIL